jgi:hypothetical protein
MTSTNTTIAFSTLRYPENLELRYAEMYEAAVTCGLVERRPRSRALRCGQQACRDPAARSHETRQARTK